MPLRVGVGEVGRDEEPPLHHAQVVPQRARVGELVEPLEVAPGLEGRGAHGEQPVGGPVDDGAEVRLVEVPAHGVERAVLLVHLDGEALALDGERPAVEEVVPRPGRVEREGQDVGEVGVVVGLDVAEAVVEAGAQHRQADERRAVEVEPAGDGDVRLPVQARPAQVRVAEEDRVAGRGARAREGQGVRARLPSRGGALLGRGSGRGGVLLQQGPRRAEDRLHGVRAGVGEDVRDVRARDPGRQIGPVRDDVAVVPRGEAREPTPEVVAQLADGAPGAPARLQPERREVALDPLLAEVARRLAAGGQVAPAHLRRVVLGHREAEAEGRRLLVLREDVGHPERVPPDHDALGERPVRGGGGGEDGEEGGPGQGGGEGGGRAGGSVHRAGHHRTSLDSAPLSP